MVQDRLMDSGTTTTETFEEIRLRLIREAEDRHADHEQYQGYWDSWALGRIKRDLQWRDHPGIENRMAREGEYVLVDVPRPSSMMSYLARGSFTFCVHLPDSPTGGGLGTNIHIRKTDVEVIS